MKTIILSGFPGVGKSFLFNNNKGLTVLDSDSSKFDKSEFPENYIRHIKSNLGKVDIICVSSHEEVRDALVNEGLHFVLVYPNLSCKDDFIERYKERGSSQGFIDLVDKNWKLWIDQLVWQKGCTHVPLMSGEYLSDIIHRYIKIDVSK